MNPNHVHTITLFRKQKEGWIKNVYQSCFWKSGIAVVQNGTDASQVNTYTVRMPADVVGSGFSVSPGDIVVKGECPDEITGKSPDTAAEVMQRNKPDAFKITAVSNNTSHLMDKHYRVGG